MAYGPRCPHPGLATSVRVTLQTGFAATLVSLTFAVGFCARASRRRTWRRLAGYLAPVPPRRIPALAIGLAFLIAPSGWIVRAVWPWVGVGSAPPGFATVGDAQGVALILALVLEGNAVPDPDDRRRSSRSQRRMRLRCRARSATRIRMRG